MEDNKDINKIRDIFSDSNKSVPADLWKKLSEQLPDDDRIEVKIKKGFDDLGENAPPYVWNSVNRQLNIDKVWERISRELDRRRAFYWRNAAALLLLFIVAGYCGLYLFDKDTEQLVGNIGKSFAPTKIRQADNRTMFDRIAQTTRPGDDETTFDDAAEADTPDSKENSGTGLTANNSVHEDQNTTVLSARLPGQSAVPVTEMPASETMSGNIELPSGSLTSRACNLPLHTHTLPDLSSLTLQNNDSTYRQTLLPAETGKIEFGITYSYNNTWILNNETNQCFDANSLISTSAVFASSYGFIMNYNITKRHALSSEYYIMSKSKQQYNEFIEGRYYKHTLEFNYTKLTLLYQLNLAQSGARKIPSAFTVKAGVYGSYLWNYSHIYNYTIDKETYNYSSFDYGIKLALGQEKQFGKIIAGYGINCEYGFNNNFAGGVKMPASFNVTRNALMGIYLNLKYRP